MYINKFFKFGTLYLGNDSGPLHLAAALNLPTVAFFVPETWRLYGYNETPQKMFYTNYFCSLCLNLFNLNYSSCKLNSSLIRIGEEEVVNTVAEIIYKKMRTKTKKELFNSSF